MASHVHFPSIRAEITLLEMAKTPKIARVSKAPACTHQKPAKQKKTDMACNRSRPGTKAILRSRQRLTPASKSAFQRAGSQQRRPPPGPRKSPPGFQKSPTTRRPPPNSARRRHPAHVAPAALAYGEKEPNTGKSLRCELRQSATWKPSTLRTYVGRVPYKTWPAKY